MKNHCKECNIPTNNLKFCSLSCSTAYKNQQKKLKRIQEYNKSPTICQQCRTTICYEKRANKFCSQSCAATCNNLHASPDRKRGPTPKYKKPKKRKEKIIVGPYCKVTFKICEHTGKIYSSRTSTGGRRRKSPYIISEKEEYYQKAKFKFNVYDYPNYFDLSLIDQYGWYTCPGKKRKHYVKNINGISRDHIISISDGFKHGYDPEALSHLANCQLMQHSKNLEKRSRSDITYEELLEKIKNWPF